jgi:hypothetical protein
MAVVGCSDVWVAASGGTETPFKARSGKKLLYVFNPREQQHAYLDCENDLILSEEEARGHLQMV